MGKRKQSNVNVTGNMECVCARQLRTANWSLLFLQLTSRDVIVFFALESRLHSTCLAVVIAITNIRQI